MDENEVQALIDKAIADVKAEAEATKKDLKSKLDIAYGKRDEMKAAMEEIKAENIELLKAQGKDGEALQKEVDALKEQLIELTAENVKLKRDQLVDKEIAGLEFRSQRSRNIALKEIVPLLEKKGDQWVGKNGKSIADVVKDFRDDPENDFLFKAKESSGTNKNKAVPPANSGISVKDKKLTLDEILEKARNGENVRNK